MDGLGFSGLPETDSEIILNAELDDIITIIHANNYLRNLVIKLLPEIVANNYIIRDDEDDPYYIYLYDDEPLYYFTRDLIDYGEFNIFKKLIKAYDKIANTEHKLYDILTQGIFDEELHVENEKLIMNYFIAAPYNYDWDKFLSNYREHYSNLDPYDGEYYLTMANEILLLVKAALQITAVKKNNDLIFALSDIWTFYRNEINEWEELYIDNYPQVKDISQEIDRLFHFH